MNDIIIYTFGQLSTFKAVLQSLSVLFDPSASEFFASNNSLGAGSAAVMASLIATLGLFSNYLNQSKVLPHGPLLGLMMYAMVCIPKVQNVWVSDIYTGRTELVQNVPLGIATIGYALSTISKGFIDEIETQYSIPGIVEGDDFLSSMTAGNGFLSPLKILVSLRHSTLETMPQHLIYNSAAYLRFCLVGTRKDTAWPDENKYKEEELTRSQTPIAYFLNSDLVKPSLMTEYQDPISSDMGVMSCTELRTILAANNEGGINYHLTDPNSYGLFVYSALASSNESFSDVCRKSISEGAACVTPTDAITKTNQLVSSVLGAANTNERYMKVRLMEDITHLIGSVSAMPNPTADSIAVAMTENIELARMQEALEGETFLHFMMPAMNALMYLFYALFPFAMVIMVAKGGQALVYFGGYLLFGLWIYSWMPIATVINFTTIANLIDSYAVMQVGLPLTISSTDTYIQRAQDAIAVGSNLLAATPIITLAIVSGSIFALTSVAQGAASPSGAASQIARQNTPSFHNAPSLVDKPSMYSSTDGTAGSTFGTSKAIGELTGRTMDLKEAYSTSATSATSYATQAKQAHIAATNEFLSGTHQVTRSVSGGRETSHTVSNAELSSKALEMVMGKGNGSTFSLDETKSEALHTGLHASTGFIGFTAGGVLTYNETGGKGFRAVSDIREEYEDSLATVARQELASSNSTGETAANAVMDQWQSAKSMGESAESARMFAETEQQEAAVMTATQGSVRRTGVNVGDSIARKGINSPAEVMDYAGDIAKKAFKDVGFSPQEAGALSDTLSKYIQAQNMANFGGESTPAATLESVFDAFSAMKADDYAIKDPRIGMALDEARNDIWGDALNTKIYDTPRTQAISSVANTAPVEKGAALETEVASSMAGTNAAVTAGKTKLEQQDPFQTQTLDNARQSANKLTEVGSAWKAGGNVGFDPAKQMNSEALNAVSQSAYGKDFAQLAPDQKRQALNNLSASAIDTGASYTQAYLSEPAIEAAAQARYAQSFDALSPSEKRNTIIDQKQASLAGFANDAKDYQANLPGMDGKIREHNYATLSDKANTMEALRKGAILNNNSEHQVGTIGKQEMAGLTSSYDKLTNAAADQFAQQNDLAAKSNELENKNTGIRNETTSTSALDRLLTGNNNGLSSNALGALGSYIGDINDQVQSGQLTREQADEKLSSVVDNIAKSTGNNVFESGFDGQMSQNKSAQRALVDYVQNAGVESESELAKIASVSATAAGLGFVEAKRQSSNYINEIKEGAGERDLNKDEKAKVSRAKGAPVKAAGILSGVSALTQASSWLDKDKDLQQLSQGWSRAVTIDTIGAAMFSPQSSNHDRMRFATQVLEEMYKPGSPQRIGVSDESANNMKNALLDKAVDGNGQITQQGLENILQHATNRTSTDGNSTTIQKIDNSDMFDLYNNTKSSQMPRL